MKNYSRIHRKRIPLKFDRVKCVLKRDPYQIVETGEYSGIQQLRDMADAMYGRRFLNECYKKA